MAKDPAVLFYTSDFMSGTEFFSWEEKGKYIHLLCTQHQNGHLPKDYISKVIGSDDSIIWQKFVVDDNSLFYNKRMDDEKIKRVNYSESRKKNISKRYESTYVDTYVSRMKVHMDNENENINDNIKEDIKEQQEVKTVYKNLTKVTLTKKELDTLLEKFGEDLTDRLLERLNSYKESKGAKYKSDYKTIYTWVLKSVIESNPPKQLTKEQMKNCEHTFSGVTSKYQFNQSTGKFYLK